MQSFFQQIGNKPNQLLGHDMSITIERVSVLVFSCPKFHYLSTPLKFVFSQESHNDQSELPKKKICLDVEDLKKDLSVVSIEDPYLTVQIRFSLIIWKLPFQDSQYWRHFQATSLSFH